MNDRAESPLARTIAESLAAAEARLDLLQRLVSEATSSPARVHGLIADPSGLVGLDDPDILEQDGLGLRPWLDDLRAAAKAGNRGPDVVRGLKRWRIAADETERAAKAVTDTNSAPLDHRRELRGRLDAARAKAVRLRLAEDTRLVTLYRQASEALDRVPTDLDLAEKLTMGYCRALAAREGRTGDDEGDPR